MGSIIFKRGTRKGDVLLVDNNATGGAQGAPTIKTEDGQIVTGQLVNTINGVAQYAFPSGIQGSLSYGGKDTDIGSAGRYEGNSIDAMTGSAGSSGSSGSPGNSAGAGYNNRYAPGNIGYGAYPANVENLFPNTAQATANYNLIDPAQFAKQYGDTLSKQYQSNYDTSKGMALDTLNTELKGLQSYVPAVSALKSNQASIENIFNQGQRTQQLNQAAPSVLPTLALQNQQANTYSTGRLTNSIDDASMNLNTRSQAADQASAGGFGAQSSVARKASDLMSAEQRFQIAQYGNSLQTQNVQNQNQIALAPTEYNNTSSQINGMPSLSASQLTQANQQQLGQYNMIPASTALQTAVGQQQFATSTQSQLSQFNAGQLNNMALQKFDYQAGYAASLAGASQTNINTEVGITQQQQYASQFQSALDQARTSGNWQAVAGLATTIFGSAYGSQIVNYLKGAVGMGGTTSSGVGSGTSDNTRTGTTTSASGSTYPTGSGNVVSGPDTSGNETTGGPTPDQVNNDANTPGSGVTQDSTGSTSVDKMAVSAATSSTPAFIPSPEIQTKTLALNNDFGIQASPERVAAASNIVNSTLHQAGIFTAQGPGTVHVNTTASGQKIYSSIKDLKSTDTSAAAAQIKAIHDTLAPTGVLSSKDTAKMQKMASLVTDPKFHSKLDALVAKGDKKGFLKVLTQEFGSGI